MISFDTNVLVRICHDDSDAPDQTGSARKLAVEKASSEGIFVTLPALIETVWVLRTRYKKPKQKIIEFIETLSTTKGISLDQEHVILGASQDWKTGNAGFVDYLILRQATQHGCRTTYTFEKRKMAKDPRSTTLEN